MEKIIITGATGFIGQKLIDLASSNYEVHVIIRSSTDISKFSNLPGSVYIYNGKTEAIMELCQQIKPDAVVHLASKFLATHSPADIEDLVESNILFGTQLLEGIAACGCKRFLNIGTSWQHYMNDVYCPVNLYAATKQAFKDILKYFEEAVGIISVTLELFDTYGPGDTRNKLISALKQSIDSEIPLALSPGEQIIDLLHIDDVVKGILAALTWLQVEQESRTFVLNGTRISIKDLINKCQSLVDGRLAVALGKRPYRIREVMVPWEFGVRLPNWSPQIGLDEGLREYFSK